MPGFPPFIKKGPLWIAGHMTYLNTFCLVFRPHRHPAAVSLVKPPSGKLQPKATRIRQRCQWWTDKWYPLLPPSSSKNNAIVRQDRNIDVITNRYIKIRLNQNDEAVKCLGLFRVKNFLKIDAFTWDRLRVAKCPIWTGHFHPHFLVIILGS